MTQPLTAPPASRLSMVQWLICVIAAIGFAFDIYELLMLPLIIRPALFELAGLEHGTDAWSHAFNLLFYVPAFAGGIFGLLGGYLTDRLGRRRVLTGSILLYACSAFAAGFSTSFTMLLVLRCTTFIGVCIEFVAAVAWLAELFPNPHQREKVLGYTQAFSSIGGLLVASVYHLMEHYASSLPAIAMFQGLGLGSIADPHAPWRYTLMSGLIPAIPLIVIRPFLPESPAWKAKREAGTLRRPSFAELFAPAFRKTTIVTTIMFACSYGAAFGAIQQIQQIIPGVSEVKAKLAEFPPPPKDASAEVKKKMEGPRKKIVRTAGAEYTEVQEVGGLIGRIILAVLAIYIVSRRALVRIFLGPGLIVMPLIFLAFGRGDNQHLFSLAGHEITGLHLAIGLAGLLTVAQFSFWGNYLPRVYPIHLRGTGESFAANVGGRMVGTSFAAITSTLALSWPYGTTPPQRTAYTAAAIAFGVYFVGFVCSFFLPEPPAGEMED